MTTLELIYHICTHPEYTTVVINGEDKTPIQAIELLSSQSLPDSFTLNGSLEKNTLIVYDFTLANLAPNH